MPKISIIIPIYNVEKYLEECLSSVQNQTYQDFEAIMVDDGSQDGSASICKKYAALDSRFVYIHKKNGGVSSARNRGLDVARGEYVSFIDSDDWVEDDYLETFMAIEKKADITFFGETTIEMNGDTSQRIPKTAYGEGNEAVEELMFYLKCGPLGNVLGWTWDKFFLNAIIRKHNIRFNENLSFMEDEVFTLEYCRYVNSIRTIPRSLYFYRKLDTGLTRIGYKQHELLTLSACMLEEMKHFNHEGLVECMLKNATDYHAKYVYGLSFCELGDGLMAYRELVRQHPQPGRLFRVNHLTNYMRKGLWAGCLYWMIKNL